MIDFQDWKTAHEAELFQYGVNDCCLALADWAAARGYHDGAADLRGTYDNEADMYSIIAGYGDVTDIVNHCATIAGCVRIQRQKIGSIAVIGSAETMYRQWGAIWDGSHWQVRLKDGFTPIIARPLKIWAV